MSSALHRFFGSSSVHSQTTNIVKTTPFVYQSLRPFRLLRLKQNTDPAADLVCELTDEFLGNAPGYEALSYTWYDPALSPRNEPSIVLLHGHKHEVTRNLELALRHLRLPSEDRILWVDALCIDQASVPEKNQQVPQMRDVYCLAKRVLVWLGEENTARTALSFCSEIEKQTRAMRANLLVEGYSMEWAACAELFGRFWFSRAWIVQEVIHAGEVLVHIGCLEPIHIDELCGKWKSYNRLLTLKRVRSNGSVGGAPLDWVELTGSGNQNYAMWLRTGGVVEDIRDGIPYLREMAKSAAEGVEGVEFPPRLAPMLLRTREQLASVPLDKIYSVMGMSAPGYNIPVDYNMSKGDLYTIITRQLLKNILLVLLWVESPDRLIQPRIEINEGLPSWVPDFTTRQTYVSRSLHPTYMSCHADKDFPLLLPGVLEPRFVDDAENSRFLSLRGIYVGIITGIYDTRFTQDPELINEDNVRLIQYSQDLKFRSKSVAELSLEPWLPQDTEDQVKPFQKSSWAPCHTNVGDIIIVTPGSNIPLVLRKTPEENFLFVGACWLIDSPVQDLTYLQNEPGFSRIMYEGVCMGTDRSADVEKFWIC